MRGNAGRIFAGALRTTRRGMVGWTLGAAIISVFYLAFYPMIGADEWQDMVQMMPREVLEIFGMTDLTDATGYANATVYSLLGLVIVLIFALTLGARLIGGEEEAGTLELEFTAPVSRAQVYWGRIAALWTAVLVAVAGLSLAVFALNLMLDLKMDGANIWLTAVPFALLTGAFGTIAFAVGAATGRRGIALACAAGLAVVCYLMNAVGPMADLPWMADVSPFGWYEAGDPLRSGPRWSSCGWLAILAAAPALAGWFALGRRDLQV